MLSRNSKYSFCQKEMSDSEKEIISINTEQFWMLLEPRITRYIFYVSSLTSHIVYQDVPSWTWDVVLNLFESTRNAVNEMN